MQGCSFLLVLDTWIGTNFQQQLQRLTVNNSADIITSELSKTSIYTAHHRRTSTSADFFGTHRCCFEYRSLIFFTERSLLFYETCFTQKQLLILA